MCLWAIYIFPGTDHRRIVGIYKSLTDTECGNWDWGRVIPYMEIFVSNSRYCVFAVQQGKTDWQKELRTDIYKSWRKITPHQKVEKKKQHLTVVFTNINWKATILNLKNLRIAARPSEIRLWNVHFGRFFRHPVKDVHRRKSSINGKGSFEGCFTEDFHIEWVISQRK